MTANAKNYHACAVIISGIGVLIEGASGAGKTSLALGVIERACLSGYPAKLVADDQVLLHNTDGRLTARVPHSIAGKAEIRGLGITDVPFQSECTIELVAHMVDDQTIERMPGVRSTDIEGVRLSLITVPIRHEENAARIILASLQKLMSRAKDG